MTTKIPSLRFPQFAEELEWEKKKISEVAIIGRGKSKHRPRDASFLYGGKYPFIQTGDIKHADLYIKSYSQTYSEEGLKQSKLWEEDTLCITIAANIAETAILKIKACFPDSIIGLVPKEQKTTVLFVKRLFDKFKIDIQRLSQGLAQANLNQESLSNIVFYFPSLAEQTQIGNFLTAVDTRLSLLKQKYELLKSYKKGIMAQIFNQELRFKDENGQEFPEWEEKTLGEVFYSVKGKGLSKDKLSLEGKNKCILYGELYTKYNEVIFTVQSRTNFSEGLKSEIGDLLMPTSTTTSNLDIAIATALNEKNVLLGGDISVLRNKGNALNVFFAYYLSFFKKREMANYAQGTTIVHLYFSHLQEMPISLPCLAEQTKIANFLTAIDNKINNIEQQIAQSEEWKRGLLQAMLV